MGSTGNCTNNHIRKWDFGVQWKTKMKDPSSWNELLEKCHWWEKIKSIYLCIPPMSRPPPGASLMWWFCKRVSISPCSGIPSLCGQGHACHLSLQCSFSVPPLHWWSPSCIKQWSVSTKGERMKCRVVKGLRVKGTKQNFSKFCSRIAVCMLYCFIYW